MSNEGGITEGKKRKSNQLKSQHMEDGKKISKYMKKKKKRKRKCQI